MREEGIDNDVGGDTSDFKVVELGEENYDLFFDTRFKPESMDMG